MMISGIRSNVSINAVRESSGLSNIIANADIPVKDSADSPAVIMDISERARQAALEAKDANNDSGGSLTSDSSDASEKDNMDSSATILDTDESAKQAAFDTLEFKSKEDNDGSLNIDENDFSEENVEKLQQEAIEIMSRPTDPFTYEDQMRTMIYCFDENSPENTINNILEGKAINSSVVTNELSNMLRQTITNKNASVTERAENRESALKCAQYIADKYLDDSNEAKQFMSAIDDIYEEDVYTDKGYFEIEPGEWVREGSVKTGDTKLPPDYATQAFTRAYCKAHGFSSLVGLNKTEFNDYTDALFDFFRSSSSKTREKWETEGRKAFVQNENNVTEATENAKLNFNYSLFNNNIAILLKAF